MMKNNIKKLISVLLASAMIFCLSAVMPFTANAAETINGQPSYNASDNNYTVYGRVVNSYLVQNSDGTLSRVEYVGDSVIAETYSLDGKELLSSKKLDAELELFGGFFSGADYNFLIFGQMNEVESDSNEVIRVVKYSKDWSRIGSASIKGANTYIPFDAGSLRMTETDGKLYIYTCHEMYTTPDGYHHQSNMTFVINESNLSVSQAFYDIMNLSYGYVSHSFNQFIQTDGNYVYRVDHGDFYPRAISITKCSVSGRITDVSYTLPISLENVTGYPNYNATGASIGGFELSADACIIAGNCVDYTKSDALSTNVKNIFVSVTDKGLKSSKIVWLTNYADNSSVAVYTPHLVKLDDKNFLVLWEEYNKEAGKIVTKMVTVDNSGNKTSDIVSKEMPLSDCKPILCGDGYVRWYATNNSSPQFYKVNPDNLNEEQSELKLGDVNGDGNISIDDVTDIQKYMAEMLDFTYEQIQLADTDRNGEVTIDDVTLIQKHLAGLAVIE